MKNPELWCRGVASVELDGSPAKEAAIPLSDDGSVHPDRGVLGASRDAPLASARPPARRAGAKTDHDRLAVW